MLMLDGLTPLLDKPDNLVIEEFVRKYVPTDSYLPWLRRSWPGFGLAGVTYPEAMRPEPAFRLSRFRWPTFACRWAYGHFAMTSDQVNQLQQDCCQSGAYRQVPLLFGSPELPSGETVSVSIYVLPPTPLSGIRGLSFAATGSNSLYLITVVDARYFWWNTNTADMKVTNSTTWANLLNMVSSQLGISLTWDTIPAAYLQPSTMFNLPYEPSPVVLDALLFNVGQRLVANYNGTYVGQMYQTALSAYQTDMQNNPNRLILAGGARFANPL
jgi:hypothetical protein